MSDQEQLNRILDLVGVAVCSKRVGLCVLPNSYGCFAIVGGTYITVIVGGACITAIVGGAYTTSLQEHNLTQQTNQLLALKRENDALNKRLKHLEK